MVFVTVIYQNNEDGDLYLPYANDRILLFEDPHRERLPFIVDDISRVNPFTAQHFNHTFQIDFSWDDRWDWYSPRLIIDEFGGEFYVNENLPMLTVDDLPRIYQELRRQEELNEREIQREQELE